MHALREQATAPSMSGKMISLVVVGQSDHQVSSDTICYFRTLHSRMTPAFISGLCNSLRQLGLTTTWVAGMVNYAPEGQSVTLFYSEP